MIKAETKFDCKRTVYVVAAEERSKRFRMSEIETHGRQRNHWPMSAAMAAKINAAESPWRPTHTCEPRTGSLRSQWASE